MGDAAYERAATADEIDADVPRSCARRSRPARPGSRPASRTRTAASTASRCRAASPTRDEVDALFLAAGRTGQGRGARHRRASSAPTPTCTSGSRASGGRSPTRCSRAPNGAAPAAARAARGRARPAARRSGRRSRRGRSRCSSRWPSPYSLNAGTVFGELMEASRDAAHRRVPRSRVARARRGRSRAGRRCEPRWETFEVSESERFPELEGRRVDELARERGCSPLDVMCELAVAEDLDDPLPRLHRQRRRRRGGRPAHARARRARASPTRARTSTSCATRRCPPTCSAPGCANAASCRSSSAVRKLTGEPADMFGFVRRGYLREGDWADVCVFDPETVGTGPTAARARLPGRRRTPHRRGADRACGTCSSTARRSVVDGAQLDARPTLRPGTRPEMA